MSDRPILDYRVDWQRPDYIEGITTPLEDPPTDLINPISYPAKETDQIRLLALRCDHNTCQRCGKTIELQVHHLTPKYQGG